MWKDFHDFWLKAKVPVHIIRYEDILQRPVAAMTDLIRFICSVPTLDGTLI